MKHWVIWILMVWMLAALSALVMQLHPNQIHLDAILAKPNLSHLLGFDGLLGFDDLGRAILPRLLEGAQVSLLVVFVVTAVTGFFGISLGLVAGYYGGWVS